MSAYCPKNLNRPVFGWFPEPFYLPTQHSGQQVVYTSGGQRQPCLQRMPGSSPGGGVPPHQVKGDQQPEPLSITHRENAALLCISFCRLKMLSLLAHRSDRSIFESVVKFCEASKCLSGTFDTGFQGKLCSH